ncbi:MAG: M48 family metallopeptidase [Candidatus Bilamarchaeaceae archaeon]
MTQQTLLSFFDENENTQELEIIKIFRNVRYNRIKIANSKKIIVTAKNNAAAERILKEKYEWIEKKIAQLQDMEKKAGIPEGCGYLFGMEKSIEEVLTYLPFSREHLLCYANECVSKMVDRVPSISIRRMRSRLGAYSIRKDQIKLSSYLFFLPKELIEYVIFHELTHRSIKNHGKDFWAKISQQYSDWREKEKELDLWWMRVKLMLEKYPQLKKA